MALTVEETKAVDAILEAARTLGWNAILIPNLSDEEPLPGLIIGSRSFIDHLDAIDVLSSFDKQTQEIH